jgi:hypothetical protein
MLVRLEGFCPMDTGFNEDLTFLVRPAGQSSLSLAKPEYRSRRGRPSSTKVLAARSRQWLSANPSGNAGKPGESYLVAVGGATLLYNTVEYRKIPPMKRFSAGFPYPGYLLRQFGSEIGWPGLCEPKK